MGDVMTGKEIKAWRKSAGLEQKAVALQMGVSPATLCRIEQEDRAVSGEQLDKLFKLYANLNDTSPVIKSATKMPEIVAEKIKPAELQAVRDLSLLGKTYQYQGCSVVPSHYYAIWSGQEPRCVNQAIDRLHDQGRLEIEEDFFRLNHEESKDFIKITNCDFDFQSLNRGLVLITRKTVNTLTHYFNDPNSVEKSKRINSEYTSIEQISASNLSSREKMILMTDLCKNWLDMDEKRSMMGAQIEAVSKDLSVTAAKADATQAELEEHKQSSRLTSDQIEAIENIIRIKIKEYGHGCVKGLVQRYLKQIFLGGRATGNTFKDIACRHYSEVILRTQNWIPSPADRESISRHRIKDGMQPLPIIQPELFQSLN